MGKGTGAMEQGPQWTGRPVQCPPFPAELDAEAAQLEVEELHLRFDPGESPRREPAWFSDDLSLNQHKVHARTVSFECPRTGN